MDEKLTVVIKELGSSGIDAFYTYMILDYATAWLLIGLVAWGIQVVWAYTKRGLDGDA